MRQILLISFLVVNILSCSYAKEVILQLKWKHQFQFAGFYMAKEKGLYQKKGIDVSIKELGDYDPVDSVLEQKAQFGVDDSVLIHERMLGKSVVGLFPIYQRSPLILMGIKKDQKKSTLENKIVEIPSYSLSSITIKAMFKLTNTSYQAKPPTFKLDDLLAKKTDYISSYISNEPYKLKKLGIDPILYSPYDYGIDFYGDMLYTSKKLLDTDPKLVEEFLDASKKGWLYAFEHIDETIKVILEKYNTQNKEKEALAYEANELKKLANLDNFGEFSLAKVQNIATSYVYLSPQKYDLNNLEGFIYKKNNSFTLKEEEKEFLKKNNSFTICSRYNHYPLSREINGKLDGIAKDIFEKLADELQISFKVLPIKSDDSFMKKIRENQCDFVSLIKEGATQLPNIKTSKKIFSTTFVAIGNLQSIFIDNFSKAKGKTFYIKDKAHLFVLKSFYPNLNIKLNKNVDEIMKTVLEDHNSYYLNNKILIEHTLQKYGFETLKLSGIVEKVHANAAIGINVKYPELFPIINKVIDNFDEKYMDKVIDKYVIKEFRVVENYKYFWYLMVVFILIVVFIYVRYRVIVFKNQEIATLNRSLTEYSAQLNEAQTVAKVGSWKLYIVGNHLEWSDEIFNIFEIDKQRFDASYEAFLNRVHPEDREKLNLAYKQSLQDQQPYDIVHRLLMDDGRIKWVHEKCKTTFDEEGHPLISVGTVQDITTEKVLEQQIEMEKDFISTIIDSANAIIAVIDSDGRMIKINKYGQEFTGYSEAEISSEAYFWSRFLPPMMQNKVLDIIEKAKQGEIIKFFKNGWISKDGRERIFEWSNTLVQKKDGSMDYIATIGIDITDKEEIQNQIIKERKKYKNLMNLSSDAIFIMDIHTGKLIEYSIRVAELLGYSDEELKNISVLDWDTQINDLSEYQSISLNIWYEPIYFERVHKRKDGSFYNAAITAVKIKLLDEEYLYASVRDITAEIKLKEELVQAKELAESANKAKSEFLSNMSHEIRTPLNGIIGLTELVLQTPINEIQQEYLTRSKQSSQALLYIINDILDYSKIEAGKLDILNEEFELEKIMNTVSSLFGYSAYEKHLDFSFYMDDSIPKVLIGDNIRLVQILNNLVGNSIKFTHLGYVALKVHLREKSNKMVTLEFCIEDSGIGISKENQKKLFQSFEQLDSSTTKKYGGTGLGLMISKQLLSLMGGKIWVESEENRGSRFYFTLTLEYKEDSLIDRTNNEFFKGKKFLIVDDSAVDREHLGKLLTGWDIQFEAVDNVKEAVKLLEEKHFDLLLLDWYIPNMDSLALLDILLEKNIEIETIMMVASYGKKHFLDRAKSQGKVINKVLEKPYTPSSLFNLLLGKDIDFKEDSKSAQSSMVLSQEKKALLVEDNETNQIIASKMLQNYGFKIKLASDGFDALALLKEYSFDVVFMDIQMPNMDGFEATRKIREFDQKTPIIALSAAVMKEDKELAKKAGMNAHIAKPIIKNEIEAVIDQFFDTKYVDQTLNKVDLKEIVDIYGIEYKRLLESVSLDKTLVNSLLKKYYDRYKKENIQLEQLDIQSEELSKMIHKLKGVSGNIKAEKIYTLCSQFESATNEEKVVFLQQIIAELGLVTSSIKENIIDSLDEKKVQTILNRSQLIEKLKQLINDLIEDSFIQNERVEEIISSLQNQVENDTILRVKEYFSNYEYDKLIELLKTIQGDLDG